MRTSLRLLRVACAVLIGMAGVAVIATPADAAVISTASWSTATTDSGYRESFSDGSVTTVPPISNPTALEISTAGFGHLHTSGGSVTLFVNLLPSQTTIWSTTLTTTTSFPMAMTIPITSQVGLVNGVRISSSPFQQQTYHSFSDDDTVTLTASASVPTECSDGLDNDFNGRTDYPSDSGCTSPSDSDESSPSTGCPLVGGFPVCTSVETGGVFLPVRVSDVATGVAATHRAIGEVDIYRFDLETGGSVTVPCVVLTINGTTTDPCGQAGGTLVQRLQVLYDESVDQPSATLTGTLASANVCNAQVTVQVAGIGVEDFPAFTLC